MKSSKEILFATGISRATLNNYIKSGLLPKPTFRQPEQQDSDAKLMGYFPDETIDRIEQVQRLKKEGLTMAEVVARIGIAQTGRESIAADQVPATEGHAVSGPPKQEPVADNRRAPRLTLEDVPHPAYMVNYNFELTWYNDAAREHILSGLDTLPANSEARNL